MNSLYELVVTTPGGLYRYRIGDVVKVTRFHNNTPVLQFQYRKGQLFNCCHTTEKMMYNVLVESIQSFGGKFQLEDYTCAANVLFNALPETGTQQSKGTFHVVFAELTGILTAEETILLHKHSYLPNFLDTINQRLDIKAEKFTNVIFLVVE